MSSRRGFLKMLGMGGAIGVAGVVPALAVTAQGVKVEFNFTCSCGKGILTEVPKELGTAVQFACPCGNHWTLIWNGDSFSTRLSRDGAPVDTLEEGVKAPKTKPDWLTIRQFEYERMDDWGDGKKVHQYRMEFRHRSDGVMYYMNHNIRDGKVNDCSNLWDMFSTQSVSIDPVPASEFHQEFTRGMLKLAGNEVFL